MAVLSLSIQLCSSQMNLKSNFAFSKRKFSCLLNVTKISKSKSDTLDIYIYGEDEEFFGCHALLYLPISIFLLTPQNWISNKSVWRFWGKLNLNLSEIKFNLNKIEGLKIFRFKILLFNLVIKFKSLDLNNFKSLDQYLSQKDSIF